MPSDPDDPRAAFVANDDDEVPPLAYFIVKYGGLILLLVGASVGIVLALRHLR